MGSSIMYILIGVFILGAIIIAATARRHPIDPQYRRNKLANELKWLKIGADEVERRIKEAKNCACRSDADLKLKVVQLYLKVAETAVKDMGDESVLQMENELTAHQQLLANARAHLERAEREKCDIPDEAKLGGCRVPK